MEASPLLPQYQLISCSQVPKMALRQTGMPGFERDELLVYITRWHNSLTAVSTNTALVASLLLP